MPAVKLAKPLQRNTLPVYFEVAGRSNAVSITYMPEVPRRNDRIRFAEDGVRYRVSDVLWTPNETEVAARVRLEPLW